MGRLILPALLGLAICAGCGWKRDLAQGNAAAERDQWVQAVEHYKAATEQNPHDKALQARLKQAREQAIAQLMAQATAAREADDIDTALDLLDQGDAVHPRQLEVAMLREEIIGQLADGVRQALAAEDDPISAAWDRWAPFAERFPIHPETARLRDELSAALAAEVEASAAAGAYAAAHARLKAFEDRLPLTKQLTAVRAAWASSLAREAATAARRRQRASAWVAMALAAGLSDDPEHATQRDAYRKAFDQAHGVVVGPRMVAKDRAALARLDSRLKAWFQVGAVRWAPGAPRAAISGRITIAEPSWDQSVKATVAVHEYPGPEREHANPTWLQAKTDIEAAEAALGEAQKEEQRLLSSRAAEQRSLETMHEGLASVQQSLQSVQDAFATAQAEATKAQAALDESVGANESVTQLQEQRAGYEAAVEQAQATLDATIAELDAAGASGGDVAEANQAVTEARRQLEDQRAVLDAAPKPTNLMRELARHVGTRATQLADKERLLDTARSELEARQAPVQDQLDAVARLEARITELSTELEASLTAQAEAQRSVETAQARLVAVPETIFGPTIERLEIPVQSHLRSCEGAIQLELVPSGSVKVTMRLKARAESRDEERPAVEEHGLEADPLAFPESDFELQARVEAELAKQLRAQLEAQVQLLAQARLAEAASASDPDTQLRALLLAWLLAPPDDPYAQPDLAAADEPSPAQALRAAMKERWGVDELAWLAPAE